jgi:hypothetical protein
MLCLLYAQWREEAASICSSGGVRVGSPTEKRERGPRNLSETAPPQQTRPDCPPRATATTNYYNSSTCPATAAPIASAAGSAAMRTAAPAALRFRMTPFFTNQS